MNRRYFLKSLGVGVTTLCIPGSFLLRAERYFERNNAPLIKAYTKVKETLYVREGGILCFGDPYAPPTNLPTWREWHTEYCGEDPDGLADAMGMSDNDLDYEIDEWHFREMYWNRNESPEAIAFNQLQELEIGSLSYGDDTLPVGSLEFMDGICPGNDSLLVTVEDDISLSCLQWRLEKLNHPMNIQYAN
jgi:hypothetical protein